MRAKMALVRISPVKCGEQLVGEDLCFNAVCKSGGYPADGSDEDNTYARFTPSATVTIAVRNPALLGRFVVGRRYYVDFTPAD